jgi:hypothetical protein
VSYKMPVLGQVPDTNTAEVRSTTVGSGMTDPWLDTALEVRNVSRVESPRVPSEARRLVEETGGRVDYAGWERDGKVHVRWAPDKTYNAVDYANIARRIFAQAGSGFGSGARVIMPRYRINNRLSSAQWVYPTEDPIGASAPELARRPIPEDLLVPPAGGRADSDASAGGSQSQMLLLFAGGSLIAGGLVYMIMRNRPVARNRRRRRS